MTQLRSALVFGATGACGRDLVTLLANDNRYDTRHAVVRRQTELPANVDPILEPNLNADTVAKLDQKVDSVFCCLGTTIKQAGSQRAFRAIDEHLINATIDFAQRCDAKHFHLISAAGANESSMFFYSRIKAKTEAHLAASSIPNWTIYQPSLLLRNTEDFRLGERLGEWLMAPIKWIPGLHRYAPVATEQIAQSMIARDFKEPAPYPYYREGGAGS